MTFDYTGTYTAAFTADGQQADTQGKSIETTETDQNAVLAQNAGTAVLQDCTIAKSGDDRCNFYGANELANETYDRSAFDEYFGTSTAWTMGQVE